MENVEKENTFVNTYKLRWSRIENWEPGKIFSQLEKIYQKDPSYLDLCIDEAISYDLLGTALCAYIYLPYDEYSEIYDRICNATTNKMEVALQEAKEIVDDYKKENAEINAEFGREADKKRAAKVRNARYKVLGKKLEDARTVNYPKLSTVWKSYILLMNEKNTEQIEPLALRLVETFLDGTEKLHRKIRKNMVEGLCEALVLPVNDIGESPDNDIYVRSMYLLKKVLEDFELEAEEVHFVNRLEMDKIDDFTKKLLKEYVESLFNEKKYRTLSSFLHKTVHNDYEELYGETEEAFWDRLVIGSQSDRLAECRLRLSDQMTSVDGLDEWYKWVRERVSNPICLGWCQWAKYCLQLEILIDTEIETEEDFQRIATERLPILDYPFEETRNLKRPVSAAIHIYGEMWKRRWNVKFLVDLWGENNFFSYNRRRCFNRNPSDWENEKKPHDWLLNSENFFSYYAEPADRVYVYMNSPMRFFWVFREFVIAMAKEYGGYRIGELFHEYELEGILRKMDFQTSARSRMKFELNPRYVLNVELWDEVENKTSTFFDHLVHVDERYYREHEDRLHTMSIKSVCTFRLCGYAENGAHDGILLIDDVLGGIHRTDIVPEEEMQKILDWMREMQEAGRYIHKTKPGFRFVYDPDEVGMTHEFAVEILKTAYALRDSGSVRSFIGQINRGTMDKISRFQYLPGGRHVDDYRVGDKDEFNAFRRDILLPYANGICADESLTKIEKCNIYMNTLLKCFFSLAEFWNKAKITSEDMISFQQFNWEHNKFMFLVDFIKNENGNSQFRLHRAVKIRVGLNEKKEGPYRWVYEGELPDAKENDEYRVTIKDIDIVNKIVWIEDVYPEKIKDAWSVHIRYILDLKNDFSVSHVENIKRKLKNYPVEYFEKRRVVQLASHFDSHFLRAGKEEYPEEYNLFWCRNILTAIGDENPFKQKERVYKEQTPEPHEIQEMRDGYTDFMIRQFDILEKDPKAFTAEEMMDFFYNSPYYLYVEEEEFLNTMVEHFEISSYELNLKYEEYKKQVAL